MAGTLLPRPGIDDRLEGVQTRGLDHPLPPGYDRQAGHQSLAEAVMLRQCLKIQKALDVTKKKAFAFSYFFQKCL